ncbi:NAD(P)-dependent oxidoreductase [Rhizobium sp. SG570]|uniref:NAD(P)-dependent oxidoreductase n=1 Tax=Rhizobium sp. SG570 TaxID=2587113 RepID=UPI001FEF6E72|nr:NAD(P)-dependent oxidoreductase [Rhizobium sp. SG570]
MKILLLGHYHHSMIEELGVDHEVFQVKSGGFNSYLDDVDIVVLRSHVEITSVDIEQAPQLSLIIKAGSGFDNIDMSAARRRGITVDSTPAASRSVADHSAALLLCAWRRLPLLASELRAGNWAIKYEGLARDIEGHTLGILGFGQIGRIMAKRSAALGFNVSVFDRSPMKREKQSAARETGASFNDLGDLLRNCSALSIHLPLTKETEGMIGEAEFNLMPDGVVLVNTGRAGIFDKSALLSALRSGKVAAAGLDVFHFEPLDPSDELLKLPNVICTPHVGAQTSESMENIGAAVVARIQEHAAAVLRNVNQQHSVISV